MKPAEGDERAAIARILASYDSAEQRRAVSEALGVSVSQVSRWYRGLDQLRPNQVFMLEEALDLDAGTISRELGYEPVNSRIGVEAAIREDPRLDATGRRVLLAAYRELRRPRA